MGTKQKVAEHRVVEEDFHREIQKAVDSTWIAELKKPRSGYVGVTTFALMWRNYPIKRRKK